APVVSGTVALMLEANPSLTPNLVKAILQYTAERRPGYSALRQGAGFLNTFGAVQMARFFAKGRSGDKLAINEAWSRTLIWGNHRVSGGYLTPTANAWPTTTVWGSAKTLMTEGDNIVWGTACALGVCGDNIVWGTSTGDNLVWGTSADVTFGDADPQMFPDEPAVPLPSLNLDFGTQIPLAPVTPTTLTAGTISVGGL